MIWAPAKSLEPTMIDGLSLDPPPLPLEPPDDPQAPSTSTEPRSNAPSARPLPRTPVFRMVAVLSGVVPATSAGGQTLGVRACFQLDRAGRDRRPRGDAGLHTGMGRPLLIVRMITHAQ